MLDYPLLHGTINEFERWFGRARVLIYVGKEPPSRNAYAWVKLQEVPVTSSDWQARKVTPSTPINRESGQTTLVETRPQTPQSPLTANNLATKTHSDEQAAKLQSNDLVAKKRREDLAAFEQKYKSLRRRSC